MNTRKDYLAGKCTHREYYGQFVTDVTKNRVLNRIQLSVLLKSTDEHLNDIPLNQWDKIPCTSSIGNLMRELGDYPTLAGNVCIHKEAARQIIESN